jgi:hypothetical protein
MMEILNLEHHLASDNSLDDSIMCIDENDMEDYNDWLDDFESRKPLGIHCNVTYCRIT